MWRAGITVIVRQLSNWVQGWAPPEVVGAIEARCADDFHERFFADLEQAKHNALRLYGAKLDLAKAFDTVVNETSDQLLLGLGAPPLVVALLQAFDRGHRRFVESAGHVHPDPLAPMRGLPQGDPASPLRLTCVMAAWAAAMAARCPDVKRAIYLDDR
eukprot:14190716-Alexandrium_andersonii.AAC.1